MNIQEYIESGILELYATNCLTPQEVNEVEQMAHQYPEVAAELVAIQNSLASFAASNPATPKSDLKLKVMEAIDASEKISTAEATVRSINSASKQGTNPWKYIAAACFGLFVISSIVFTVKLNQTTKQLENKTASLQKLEDQITYFTNNFNMLRSPSVVKVNLTGKEIAPGAIAVIHWNKENHNLMLDFVNLPKTDANHQYQLWALHNGQPINAGVFDAGKEMLEMKDIQNAEAFAVTLEPKGGSVNPTIEKMYLFASL